MTLQNDANVEKVSIQNQVELKTTQQETNNLPTIRVERGDVEIPVTGVRKAIASNMVKSVQEIPHAWMMIEVDATNLVKLRDSLKNDFVEKEGYPLTLLCFLCQSSCSSTNRVSTNKFHVGRG